jgi:hypothetical protein
MHSGSSSIRWRALGWFAAIVFFALWTIYSTRPMAWHLADSTHYDYGDGLLNAYILRWNLHQLAHDPLHLFDASILYPARNTLALSENMLGLSLLFAPLDWIFRDTLLLCNAVVLFSFFSLALLAFGLIWHWTGSWLAAMLAGLWIGFAPARFGQMTHMQLLSYQPMLLTIFFADRCLWKQRRRDAFGFFAFLYAQFLFGIYLFVFNLVLLSALIPVLLLVRGRRMAWRRLAAQAASGGLALALLIYPIYRPYQYVRDRYGLRVHVKDLRDVGANLTDFLNFSMYNAPYKLFSWAHRNPYSPVPWEHEVALPFTLWFVLALSTMGALWAVVRRRRASGARQWTLYLAAWPAMLLCLSLMFGPQLHFFEKAYPGFPMPYTLFFHFFPGFEGMRVPPRFIFPVTLAAPILALLPVGWALRRARGARWWLTIQGLLALTLIAAVLESRTMPIALKITPGKDQLPEFVRVLRHQADGPVMIWPLDLDRTGFFYEYLNSYFWNPMVNGRSGYLPPDQGKFLDELIATFPSDSALDLLRRHGVRYIAFYPGGFAGAGAAERAEAARAQLDAQTAAGKLKPVGWEHGAANAWRLD